LSHKLLLLLLLLLQDTELESRQTVAGGGLKSQQEGSGCSQEVHRSID
jgi:hypothetical protein